MGKPPRLLECGATYHVTNRGNHRESIYIDDRARRRFIRLNIEQQERYGVVKLAGCQMGNHFHEIVTTPNGNLDDYMEQLQSQFTRYTNWRCGQVGHLFQGPYRAIPIEHDVQLVIALSYVFYNPVSAGLVKRPEDYEWSTYAATVGLAPKPGYLSIDWLSALFPGLNLKQAQERFHQIMIDGDPLMGYLNDHPDAEVDADALKRVVRSYIGEQLQLGMLPRMYRSVLRSSLAELFPDGISGDARRQAIYDAHVTHGYKLAEIARELHVNPSTISKLYRSALRSRSSG